MMMMMMMMIYAFARGPLKLVPARVLCEKAVPLQICNQLTG